MVEATDMTDEYYKRLRDKIAMELFVCEYKKGNNHTHIIIKATEAKLAADRFIKILRNGDNE